MGGFPVMDQEALFVSTLALNQNIPKFVPVSFSGIMLQTITEYVRKHSLASYVVYLQIQMYF